MPWAKAHGYRQISATRYGGSRAARRSNKLAIMALLVRERVENWLD